ncbi:hypothetical protein [Tropicimonas sp. IMCC6043]|uniref:hypothetical protein n=1 Tax=Tropicimonas sp. IMCC6043 TaxID=2510645 RepID=UPI00101D6194|nr:hypothetical protein [Tropicimonas sp. IMCC6043]RYH09230.1 hypothetical protein EU800_13575 [Tropicimonas sp. IMCC6043]
MTGFGSKDEFSERLRRIESERIRNGRASTTKRLPDFSNLPEEPVVPPVRRGGLGAGSVMAALMLFLAMVAGVAVYVFRDSLPLDGIGTELGRLAASVRQTSERIVPWTLTDEVDEGRILRAPMVATADFREVKVDRIVREVQLAEAGTRPAAMHEIAPMRDCRPRPLGAGEGLANLRLESGPGEAGMQGGDGAATTGGPRPKAGMPMADVFLTDTTTPQYVVLQNMRGAILWNLHTAPGVEIAHVLVISPGGAAVSATPGDFGIEAIRIGDYLSAADFEAIARNDWNSVIVRECFVAPFRQPQPIWRAWKRAEDRYKRAGDTIRRYQKGRARFDVWFTRSFGQSAATNAVEAYQAEILLAGPLPDQPFDPAALDAREVWVMPGGSNLSGSAEEGGPAG